MERCSDCNQEVGEEIFCKNCGIFLLAPSIGKRASIKKRVYSTILDLYISLTFFCWNFLLIFFGLKSYLICFFISIVMTFSYFFSSYKLMQKGQTFGKWIFKYQVICLSTAKPLGFKEMMAREFILKPLFFIFTFSFSFLSVIKKDTQITLHDRPFKSVVIEKLL